ncbi:MULTISPECIES: DUF1192 domain-containing protein [Rhizobium]|jgi:uncharacterized small protein (DUF1192 family)|uniref:DUF1192 domain-containing protein n=3 Tax=Rhizobium TaxID=379 RepID=A0A1L5NMK6_9HYPH|nr:MULTISPECIES: DUF1192 domain-containing protein [Rhizobium]OWK23848.1 hypothetical protein AJ87_27645 [Rhizobium yanglingense]APO69126.1 hypothetical protein IE4872_CH03534 [Rhizobium gallicum]MBB4231188.1 uncharacterized small protein (DUF1192 family) [Rhizobium mongolense]QPB19040.1 DUF1192 domain-containing protein [Rhizobium sp. 007]TVZ66514.1 uncharacterized small protein (DUF1192 family) [Rhizobium mongolense USDA 1844]
MSFIDDDLPKKAAYEIGSDLSMLSVDELKERVEQLKAEITRIEAEVTRKASGRAAAESLFRS